MISWQISWLIIKNRITINGKIIKPLAKSILIPLALTVAPADAGIHKEILGSGATTLILSNEEMEEIMKIVKYLEDFGLSLKRVSETVQNEAKEQKGGFLSMLLGTLGASLLGNLLTGKGINKKDKTIELVKEL